MNLHRVLWIAFFLSLPVALAQEGKKGGKKEGQLVGNGGFEAALIPYPGNWSVNSPGGQGIKVGIDETESFEGEQCGALQNYNTQINAAMSFNQTVDPQKLAPYIGRELTISAAIKTEQVTFADVRVEGFDGKGKPVDALSITGEGLQGTNGWKKYEAKLTIPQGLGSLTVRCVVQGAGTAWFDSVELKPLALEKSESAAGMLLQLRENLGLYLRAEEGSKQESDAKELLRGVTIEAVGAALSKGGFYYLPADPGSVHEEEVSLGRSLKYRVTLPSQYKSEGRSWPVAIDLLPPESKKAKESWSVSSTASSNWVVVRLTGPALRPSDPQAAQALLDCVRDLSRKYNIDRTRVCLIASGESSDVGLRAVSSFRGEFAALALLRPKALVDRIPPENAAGLPIFLAVEGGERSTFAPQILSFSQKKVLLQMKDLDPSRDLYAALGEDLFRWMNGKLRPGGENSFEEAFPSPEAKGSYWIDIERFQGDQSDSTTLGKIKVTARGNNQVEIQGEGVQQVRLILDPRRFVFDKPVKIYVGTEPKAQYSIQTDFDRFLTDLKKRADPTRIPAGWVDFTF